MTKATAVINNYSKELNNILKDVDFQDNILEQYNNYTYNFCFYFLSKDDYDKYSNYTENYISRGSVSLRSKADVGNNDFNLSKFMKRKYIISQSGVSTDFCIKSLKMTTIPNMSLSNYAGTTTEMTMELEELLGSSFVNKLFLVSRLSGWKNYNLMPVFLDIWFTGYKDVIDEEKKVDSYGGEIGTINPMIGKKLTYPLMIAKFDTTAQSSSTTYKLTLLPYQQTGMYKKLNTLNTLGEMTIPNKMGAAVKWLEDKINGDYYEKNKGFLDVSNKPYFEIYFNSNDPAWQPEDLLNAELLKDSKDNPNELVIKTDKENILDNIFQTLINLAEKDEYREQAVAKTSYHRFPIEADDGKMYDRYVIEVNFFKSKEKELHSKEGGDEKNQTQKSTSELKENMKKAQVAELKEIKERGAFVKKYSYRSGDSLSVLKVSFKNNNLWYLNTFAGIKQIKENSNIVEPTKAPVVVGDASNSSSKQSTSEENKNYYLTDKYNKIIQNNTTDAYNSVINLYFENSVINQEPITEGKALDANSDNVSDMSIVSYQVSNYGFNTAFKSGYGVNANIEIIGDPYWLSLIDAEHIYGSEKRIFILPYILFYMKSLVQMNAESQGEFDKFCFYNGIYQITSIESTFAEGKFTQTLMGVLSPLFMAITAGE